MNCLQFDHWLESAICDRQRELSPEAEAHLKGCATCRGEWERQQHLDQSISAWRVTPDVPDFTQSVLAKLAADRTAIPPTQGRVTGDSNRILWRTMLVPATVLALSLMLVFVIRFHTQPDREAKLVAADSPASLIPSLTVPANVSDLFAAVPRSLGGYRTASSEAHESWQVPGWETPLPAVNQTVDHVEKGLRPLGEGVGEAFGFLRTFVPDDMDAAS